MYRIKPQVNFAFSSAPFIIGHYFISGLSNFGHENIKVTESRSPESILSQLIFLFLILLKINDIFIIHLLSMTDH